MQKSISCSQKVAWKIAIIYILSTVVYIFITDSILSKLNILDTIWISMGKASFFTIVTGCLLYKLIEGNMKILEDREQQLNTLIDHMPDFVNFKDGEGNWIKANKFAIQLFNLESIQFKGKRDSELENFTNVSREKLISCENSDEKVWKDGKLIRYEEVIPISNEEYKIFDTIKVPIFHTNGQRKGLIVIGRDITDKKKIEQRLKDNEQLYRSLVENNTDAIINLDLNFNILSVNEATEKITGYCKEELVKKPFRDLVDKEDQTKVTENFIGASKGKTSRIEMSGIHKKGHSILLDVKSEPIRINEKLVGIFAVVRDITAVKEKEELIRKSEKLSVVGELACAVAHEVRNPLTSLKGFIQLLQYKNINNEDQDKHYYDIMLTEIERINLIVSEFMMLSRPQAITYQNKNVVSLLVDVITLLETIAIMKNIEVTREFESNISLVKCEGNQIKQVFINIFKNAIEAVPNNGKIHIKVEKWKNNRICISFSDNGNGIPNDLIGRLGEPFYTTKEKGTGLGLMVCYKIIEEHGGRINIKSEMNQGTTVDIIFPISIDE
ncbi:PAS domain-containing sensor histidine kinase [Priestia megaterium]|uniref:PAS domain-containing sensor histidine kinase n=1 Tax=Priestia megaterium TaxID=1404 RepID=UPI000BFA2642|nr:PAS domain S-box protein [Priestia megaterium]PFP09339.1 PAS domain-containing sensor histidine kinase [Priestia megaterium]PFU63475.1 PAS domain-containing sensor histidine kinase [Priestia megaterium]